MRWLLFLALTATPAAAECFTSDTGQFRASYADGSSIDFLSREGGVIRYEDAGSRSIGMVYRAQSGIWPLNVPTPAGDLPLRLEGPLPDIAAIRAAGRVEVTGATEPPAGTGAEPQPLRITVEWRGSVDHEMGGCTWRLERLYRQIQVGDTRTPDGELWLEPQLMIAFRSVFYHPGGQERVYELTGLE